MLALPRGWNKAAPTTPLLSHIIAYAVREVKMRAVHGRRPRQEAGGKINACAAWEKMLYFYCCFDFMRTAQSICATGYSRQEAGGYGRKPYLHTDGLHEDGLTARIRRRKL